jgi:uncharacterized membrane protein
MGGRLLLGACYPLLAHLAVLRGSPRLIATSIGLLVAMVLLPGLRRGLPAAWLLLAASAAGLYAVADSARALLLLFLPPILITSFVAWLFGHTLRAGRMPLIERVARAIYGPDSAPNDDVVSYARRVTMLWTCALVLLAAVNLVLALLAAPGGLLLEMGVQPVVTIPVAVWSLFANVLNYVIIGVLFAAEYQFRRRRFPSQPHGGFVDFTRRLAALRGMFGAIARD